MNWSALSEAQLNFFLNSYTEIPAVNYQTPMVRAQRLFDFLQKDPNWNFPEYVVDLFLASKVSKKEPKYLYEQISDLSDGSLATFSQLFGVSLSRQRLLNILKYAEMVTPPQNILSQIFAIENTCAHLDFQDAVKYREALGNHNLECRIPISDSDGIVSFLPGVNPTTIYLYQKIQSDGSRMALMSAVHDGNLKVVQILSDLGLDLKEPFNGVPPLITAAMFGHLDLVKLLVEDGTAVDAKSDTGETALLMASRDGHLEVVRYLIQRGANVKEVDLDRNSALHFAAEHGRLEVVKYLLDHDADPNLINVDDQTAADLAKDNDHPDVVYMLWRH